MPSFDISSKVDVQTLDNAINNTHKTLINRYDFKGSHILMELDKKNYSLKLEADSEMKLAQIEEAIISFSMKQGIDAKAFDFSGEAKGSGKFMQKEVKISNGLDREQAKKIVKLIKDSKIKVQTAIRDDIVYVSGKKIDDLQEVIQICKTANINLPLQFINMKS